MSHKNTFWDRNVGRIIISIAVVIISAMIYIFPIKGTQNLTKGTQNLKRRTTAVDTNLRNLNLDSLKQADTLKPSAAQLSNN